MRKYLALAGTITLLLAAQIAAQGLPDAEDAISQEVERLLEDEEPALPEPIFADEEDDSVLADLDNTDISSASERMFRAQQNGENGSEVDKLLAGVMTELNADCPAIERYQTFNINRAFVSMKVRCSDRATYAITLGPVGVGVISGGDGSVARIDPDDGDIRVTGQTAAVAPETVRLRRSPISVKNLAIAGFLLLAAIGLYVAYMTRRAKLVAPWRGLRSEDKDRLITESNEIWPGVHRHDSGIWIARGRRGKRRLFRNQAFALAYARYGLKLYQIR